MYYVNADGSMEQVPQQRCNCKRCHQKYKGGGSWFTMKNFLLLIVIAVVIYVLYTSDCKSWIFGKSVPPPPPRLSPPSFAPSPATTASTVMTESGLDLPFF